MNLFGPARTVKEDGSVDLNSGLPYLNNFYGKEGSTFSGKPGSDPDYHLPVATPNLNLQVDPVPQLDAPEDPGQDDDSVIGGLGAG